MKCLECRTEYVHLGFNWYGHPLDRKWTMPMDGYLPEHWERVLCSNSGDIKKTV